MIQCVLTEDDAVHIKTYQGKHITCKPPLPCSRSAKSPPGDGHQIHQHGNACMIVTNYFEQTRSLMLTLR